MSAPGASAILIGDTSTISPSLSGHSDDALGRSYQACRAITRREARNFYYGLRLTPEPRRSAVYSIYAWMRRADDLTDQPGTADEKRWRLSALRARTREVLGGSPVAVTSDEPFWPAFAATLASYPVDPANIGDTLDGMEEDLDHAGYQTWAELDRYCYRVASTVGLTCISIWGLRPGADAARARALAVVRGRAFQLTNILRDIGHDWAEAPARFYLPRELLLAHGVSAPELCAWSDDRACRAVVVEAAARARGFYEESSGLESMIDPACAPALWGMTGIYAGLLALMERDPARSVGVGAARARLSAARKGMIALGAVVRKRSGAWA